MIASSLCPECRGHLDSKVRSSAAVGMWIVCAGVPTSTPNTEEAPRNQLHESRPRGAAVCAERGRVRERSEEHTSELQSLMRISYAVFCLKKKKPQQTTPRLAPSRTGAAHTVAKSDRSHRHQR